jgi:hypothetical protein
MELLIDTNVIYYLSGVSRIDGIDVKKLEYELSNYQLFISQWTLVEIVSDDIITEQKRESLLKYIAEKKMKSLPIIGDNSFSLMPLNLADIISSPYKEVIKNSILKGKKKDESKLVAFYIKSVICVFSSALYFQIESENGKGKEYIMALTQSFLLGNDAFIEEKAEEFIEKFYADKSEPLFKSEVDGFICTLLYANLISFAVVEQKYIDNLFPDKEYALSASERKEFTDAILSSKVINSLFKKICDIDIKNFSKKLGESNIKKAFNAYKTVIGSHMPIGILSFFLSIIEKMLSVGMRITKNDMIDSQLLYYYPKLQLFTCDIRFKNIIKEFDESFYNFILNIENKCKI